MRVLLSCKIVLMLIGILKISKIEKIMKFSSFWCRLISISNTKGGFFMPEQTTLLCRAADCAVASFCLGLSRDRFKTV